MLRPPMVRLRLRHAPRWRSRFRSRLTATSLRASLLITPNADGDLVLKDLPDGRQLALFAPFAGWQPATSYAVTLRAGAVPVGGNLPLLTPKRWSFTTAPQPALTGRFPGEGQTLPPGQEIQLIFNAPIDGDAIRSALLLTPNRRYSACHH